jgi:hypothetical protein
MRRARLLLQLLLQLMRTACANRMAPMLLLATLVLQQLLLVTLHYYTLLR